MNQHSILEFDLYHLQELIPENSLLAPVSYQICQNWYKVRQNQPLSLEDAQQYQRIVSILQEMAEIIAAVKTTIQNQQIKHLEIWEKTCSIMSNKLGIEVDKITPTANLMKDLGATSLNALELIVALENTFDVNLPDDFTDTIETVQNIIDYINQKTSLVNSYAHL